MQLIIAILALVVGAAFTLGGWRFFLFLLPIWAFVVGFNVGTDAVSALFGDGSFATVTSWVVGFVLALIFAIFSYLYYYIAVAVLAGAVGYAIGSGAWGMIGNEFGVVAFVIGLVLAVVVAAAHPDPQRAQVPRHRVDELRWRRHGPGRLVHPHRQGAR